MEEKEYTGRMTRKLLKTPASISRNATSLYALRQLDANQMLDPYLFHHILGYQSYDSLVHTPHFAVETDNVELVKYLIDINLWDQSHNHDFLLSAVVYESTDVFIYLTRYFDISLDLMEDVFRDVYYQKHVCDIKLVMFIIDNYTPIRRDSFIGRAMLNQKDIPALDMIQLLISKDWISWDTAFAWAFESNRLDIIQFCVDEQGMDVTEHHLKLAVDNGNLNIVQYLLDNGVEVTDEIFQRAAVNGYLDIVYLLLDYGADANQGLLYASSAGHLDVVKALVENGADVSDEESLISAIKMGYLEIVKYLIEHGADMDTALLTAAYHGRMDIVRLLVEEFGVKITREAVFTAMNRANVDIFKYFMEEEKNDLGFI